MRSPAAESDAYFATRPYASQLNAWSSDAEPAARAARGSRARRGKARRTQLGVEHDGTAARPVPRPTFWGGYRLWIETVELWAEGAHRFHERLRYRRDLDRADAYAFRAGAWSVQSACNPERTSAPLIQHETVTCPYCWETIEIALDLSVEAQQLRRGLLGLL